jgi:NAD(P)-dependent dehydrogenase (short-subunit alcohol dehydrogenase family)
MRTVSSLKRCYTAVVNTSSRGIGLEFTKQLLTKPNTRVIALTRSHIHTKELQELLMEHGDRLRVVSGLHLDDPSSIQKCISTVTSLCQAPPAGTLPAINLLINCAGILGDNSVLSPGPEKSVLKVDPAWLLSSMQVNFISHVLMTQGLAPLMKHRLKKDERSNKNNISKIVNLSARVGSIDDNKSGGWLSYRCSKSALNQFTRTASIELKRDNCAVISLHPGTTDTGLSKPFQKNLPVGQLMSPELACSKMLSVIDNLTLDDTGNFYAYDGSKIMW